MSSTGVVWKRKYFRKWRVLSSSFDLAITDMGHRDQPSHWKSMTYHQEIFIPQAHFHVILWSPITFDVNELSPRAWHIANTCAVYELFPRACARTQLGTAPFLLPTHTSALESSYSLPDTWNIAPLWRWRCLQKSYTYAKATFVVIASRTLVYELLPRACTHKISWLVCTPFFLERTPP